MTKRQLKKYLPIQTKKFSSFNVIKWIMFVIMLAYAISLIAPFLWMLLNSVKANEDYISPNHFGFPRIWRFQNYSEVFTFQVDGQSILSMFLMSILITVLGTIINVGLSAISAYCVAKYRFPGRRFILGAAIFTMVVPIIGTMPATYRMLELMHIKDSIVGVLFLYSGCFGFNFILLHSSFETISWSYAEAAQIDGAGRFQILFRVMLPLAKGPIVAVSILEAIALWNDYATPRLYMPNIKTLAVGLQELQTANGVNYPLQFAAVMVAVVPIFVLFACFQKTIIKNTVAGGLKG